MANLQPQKAMGKAVALFSSVFAHIVQPEPQTGQGECSKVLEVVKKTI